MGQLLGATGGQLGLPHRYRLTVAGASAPLVTPEKTARHVRMQKLQQLQGLLLNLARLKMLKDMQLDASPGVVGEACC